MFSDLNKKDLEAQTSDIVKSMMYALSQLHKEVFLLRTQVTAIQRLAFHETGNMKKMSLEQMNDEARLFHELLQEHYQEASERMTKYTEHFDLKYKGTGDF